MRRIAVTAAFVVVMAGCGGGSSSKPNGEESKSPQQIVSDAADALSKVRSFHLEGSEDDKSGHTTLNGDVVLPGRVRVTLTAAGGKADFILIDATAYLKADRTFWQANGSPEVGAALADKWIKLPQSQAREFGRLSQLMEPAKIRRCLETHPGTLANGGTGSLAGTQVVIVTDKGDLPGSEPGQLYVAARGDPLPLRFTQTGTQKPGGTPNAACNETSDDVHDTSTTSDYRLSAFNEDVSITAPPDAIDFAKFSNPLI
jgi:hypothetical protein